MTPASAGELEILAIGTAAYDFSLPQRCRKNLNTKDTLKMSMKTKNRMFKILPFRGYNRRFQGRACR
jgi:hypothetical protein